MSAISQNYYPVHGWRRRLGGADMRWLHVCEEPMSAPADQARDVLTLLNEIFDGYQLLVEAEYTSLSQTSNTDVCATRRVAARPRSEGSA